MERYLIPANGPETLPIEKALSIAIELAQQLKGSVEVILLTPSKNLTGTSFEAVVGREVIKELVKGNSVKLAENTFIKMESEKTFNVYNEYSIVIALYSNQKMLDKIDSLENTLYSIIIPWTMEIVEDWVGTWNPRIIGDTVPHEEIIIENPVVEEAMKMLTGTVNLSTGLSHPSDREAAVQLFKILYKGREAFNPTSIRAWALRHGWNPNGADQIKDVSEAIINKRSIRGGTQQHWRDNILEILRQRVAQRS